MHLYNYDTVCILIGILLRGFVEKREKITRISQAECPYIQWIKCSHIFELFNGAKIIKIH